jgi:small subunit ribosomal protein S11
MTSQRRSFTTSSTLRAGNTSELLDSIMGETPGRTTTNSSSSSAPKRQLTYGERLAEATKRREQQKAALSASRPTQTPSFASGPSAELSRIAQSANAEAGTRPGAGTSVDEPYHLHVFAHKHNTHITFTEPSRNVICSFSCGNIGLKKAQRSSFDAAYQLATYAMKRMAMISWRMGGKKMPQSSPVRTLHQLNAGFGVGGVGIEVVMRGFGPGREAFQKALLGSEGALLRGKISKVTDATRLKFGGARSPAVRRLG